MRDPRFKILEQLTGRLDPLTVPTYSVIPNDVHDPFIYIGDVQLSEVQNKSGFTLEGFVTVELHGGSNEWVGSIAPLLTELDNIKSVLQTVKGDKLDLHPLFNMVYWTLSSDSGLLQYSSTERLYVATLQYTFKIFDLGVTITDNVVHFGVDVIHSGEPVIHSNI